MSNVDVFADGVLRFEGKDYRCALGKSGVGVKRSEGDNITPTGTFRLKQAFYRSDRLSRPDSKLDFRSTESNECWCNDPNDKAYYNQLATLPHAGSHELMWRDDNIYDIVVALDYNTNPVEVGKGSAIFIHVARDSYAPTEGCIALSERDLRELLADIEPNTTITIHTGL